MPIEPRTLKGFRDFLPAAMIERERVIDVARTVYRSYGFVPIDTPVLEHLDILLGKGSDETDRQLYRFADHGGRAVGMRFDLTVPLARFVAQHLNELGTPFKRYHIAKVWRGENTQHGRYREFMQCDFDTIGTESLAADGEMILVVHDLFNALGVPKSTIRINHRGILNGALERAGLSQQSVTVLRALDKLGKAGRDAVALEMESAAGATREQADAMLRLAEIQGPPENVLQQVLPLIGGSTRGEQGVADLGRIVADIRAAGIPDSRFALDLSIARGLDYYSGIVIETILDDLPGIGSVCSGGRYDDLASTYTNQRLPGVGASLGLDRILAALEELGQTQTASTAAPVFIVHFDSERHQDYLRLAARLRKIGIGVELYPEPKKIAAQLKYADGKGFQLAIVAGSREFDSRTCQVKLLRERTSIEVPLDDEQFEAGIRAALLRPMISV